MKHWAAILVVLVVPWVCPAAMSGPALGASLQERVDRAAAGDRLWISPGVHRVRTLEIRKPLVLEGRSGDSETVIDGGGEGDVIRVGAPGVSLRGLTIRNSGMNLTEMNAGIFVEGGARDFRLEDSRIERTAFGVWVNGAAAPVIRRNRIRGNPDYVSPDRGNGIHLWNVHGARIEDNEVWQTRDGIYIEVSHGENLIRGNRFHHLRYGVHYMYSHGNEVADNHTHATRAGYALMQSSDLDVHGNRSEGDLEYGVLLNYVTYSRLRGNRVLDVGGGPEYRRGGKDGKALFVFNSQGNEVRDNLFGHSDMGIHLTAGSEGNIIAGNAFIDNRIQVKYVATRQQEWSDGVRGNYWSDYLGWDLDADGVGDRPYEPNDNVDLILWKYPMAKVLMHSPAVQTLRWVQQQFPVLKAPGVRDSHPLMHPPASLEREP